MQVDRINNYFTWIFILLGVWACLILNKQQDNVIIMLVGVLCVCMGMKYGLK